MRNTQDVDLLVRHSDFDAVKVALESVGFVHQVIRDVDCFIDGETKKPRDAVHLIYAGEKVRPDHPAYTPDVTGVVDFDSYKVLALEALVSMQLNSFRTKERVDLDDMLEVGLIDSTWLSRLIPEHAARLQVLIDDLDGWLFFLQNAKQPRCRCSHPDKP